MQFAVMGILQTWEKNGGRIVLAKYEKMYISKNFLLPIGDGKFFIFIKICF